MSDKSIMSNLKWSKYFILTTNLLAAILFYIAYKSSSNLWFLFTAIVLGLVFFAAGYFFIKLEAKFKRILNNSQNDN